MMWRAVSLLVAATIVSGCAQLASLTGRGGPGIVVEPDVPEAMLVSVPSLPSLSYAVPISQAGTVVTWRTSEDSALSLDRGVLVSTRGFGDDLMGADAGQSIAAVSGGAGAEEWAPRINGYMNGEYQSYFMSFQCRRTGSHSDQITVENRSVPVTRITETCVNDERQIENQYWRNSNGVMLKSRQWVSPRVGYMETERVIR